MPAGDTKSHERKLAAILAADVAGYSKLMADDELATVKAIKAARRVFGDRIEAHSGRLIDTAGDSVLAEFKSVVEAVQCAVEVQEKLEADNRPAPEHRKMHFRIGINLGDIIEEDDGTIYGDGVNVAARLEGLATPGGVMLSGSAHEQVVDKLDLALADAGEHEVKNIARPVRAWRVVADGAEIVPPTESQPSPKTFRKPKVLVGLAAAIAVVFGLAVWGVTVRVEMPQMVTADGTPTDDPVFAMPTGPTIAVLPFDNLSGDEEQDLFAEGLAADISRQLSLQPEYFVIGRGTTAHFTRRSVLDLGRELGVAFVVQGTVRNSGNDLRVTAALIDAGNGKELWSNAYDRTLNAEGMFEIQDEITNNIALTIGDSYGVIAKATREIALARGETSLSGFECVLLAYKYFERILEEDHLRARDCLENAVADEPNFADAWGWLAIIYSHEKVVGYNLREGSLDRALSAGQKAIGINDGSQMAWEGMAAARFFRHEYEEFDTAAKRALSINPNDAATVANIALYYGLWGKFEISLPLMEKVMVLSPHHQFWYHYPFYFSAIRQGEYTKAVKFARQSRISGAWFSHMYVAAALAQAGEVDEARMEVEQLLGLMPSFPNFFRVFSASWNFPKDIEQRLIEGFEKAGVQIPDENDEPEAPTRPTIAVLPFSNMSDDPDQLYFAHGITEDIITRLAQFPDLLVLGRNTTFQFEGQAVDIPTIAEKLNADYIVEGSIRRGGDTVRVTAQLLEGKDGTHVWAETFDRALDPANIFAVQDKITATVASRIGDSYGAVAQSEYRVSNRHMPQQLSSYECVLRYFQYERDQSLENHRIARDCLENAVKVEPEYGEAMAYLGVLYINEIALGQNPTTDSPLEKALELSRSAAVFAPESGPVRIRFARALHFDDQPEIAIEEVESALLLEPNNVDVLGVAAEIFTNTGAWQRAVDVMDNVEVLNPNYPAWMNWMKGTTYFVRGEHQKVLSQLELTQMEWWWWTHAFRAAAHCATGNVERGKESLKETLILAPNFAELYWQEFYFWNKGPNVRAKFDVMSKGLTACGWDVPPDPGREAFAPVQ